jgi:hypothetical protein
MAAECAVLSHETVEVADGVDFLEPGSALEYREVP